MAKDKLLFVGALITSFIGMIIGNILLGNTLYQNLYLGQIPIIKYDGFTFINILFGILIFSSTFLSQSVLVSNLKYELYFGNTRKKVYQKHLQTVLKVLLIFCLYVIINTLCTFIINSFKEERDNYQYYLDLLISLLVYSSLYLLLNFLTFSLSSIYNTKVISFIVSVVLLLLYILLSKLIPKVPDFVLIILIGSFFIISLFLVLFGKKIIMKYNVGNIILIDDKYEK